jgi:hypothetical protein
VGEGQPYSVADDQCEEVTLTDSYNRMGGNSMAINLSADGLSKAISYYYLVNYCPPEYVNELKKTSKPLRKQLADQAGLTMTEFFSTAVPEICRRIVAFHQNTRKPDEKIVKALTSKARRADSSPENATAFQAQMAEISQFEQRADLDKRLHRKKGCHLCAAPCRYGFFTLVSEPHFGTLQRMLEAENRKPDAERSAINVLWTYTTGHLWRTLNVRQGFVNVDHLANLSYCLLMLATAKSRFALPEKQLIAFQEANQNMIRTWSSSEISLVHRQPTP